VRRDHVLTILPTTQIALSMALLVAAGLFIKSLVNVSRVELGLKAENVIMFAVSPALNGYTPERTKQFYERAEEALAVSPGGRDGVGKPVNLVIDRPDAPANSNTDVEGLIC